MNNLKKLCVSVVVTLALVVPAFAGVIECPVPAPLRHSSTARKQSDSTFAAASTEAGSEEPGHDESLTEAAFSLLETIMLALF
jgi:hypothetical protein